MAKTRRYAVNITRIEDLKAIQQSLETQQKLTSVSQSQADYALRVVAESLETDKPKGIQQ